MYNFMINNQSIKFQLVKEWEIAKKVYALRGINWKTVPEMIKLCDDIGKEMIEIDRATEAMRCLGRYHLAVRMILIIRVRNIFKII